MSVDQCALELGEAVHQGGAGLVYSSIQIAQGRVRGLSDYPEVFREGLEFFHRHAELRQDAIDLGRLRLEQHVAVFQHLGDIALVFLAAKLLQISHENAQVVDHRIHLGVDVAHQLDCRIRNRGHLLRQIAERERLHRLDGTAGVDPQGLDRSRLDLQVVLAQRAETGDGRQGVFGYGQFRSQAEDDLGLGHVVAPRAHMFDDARLASAESHHATRVQTSDVCEIGSVGVRLACELDVRDGEERRYRDGQHDHHEQSDLRFVAHWKPVM